MRLIWILTSFGCLSGCGSPSEVEPPPRPAQGGSSTGTGTAGAFSAGGSGGSAVPPSGGAAGVASGGSAGENSAEGAVAGSGGTGATSGGSVGDGGSAGSGGTAGGPYPTTPPVRDSASKVPISNAGAGYTVEGNHVYGPLTAQRLDVIYPNDAGPNGTAILPVVLMFHGGAWIHSYTNNYGSGKD